MPSTMSLKNTGATTIPAKHLADTDGAGGVRLAAAAQQGQTSPLLSVRPLGLAAADLPAGQTGEVQVNGRRTGRLAAGYAVTLKQPLISAGGGELRPAPSGWTGWIAALAAEAKSSSATPQDILIDVGARPVT